MLPRRCLIGILALFMFIAVANAREWTDSTGKYKSEAEFIELKDGVVKLRMQTGVVKSVPLEKLSDADQEFARQSAPPPRDAPVLPHDALRLEAVPSNSRAIKITAPWSKLPMGTSMQIAFLYQRENASPEDAWVKVNAAEMKGAGSELDRIANQTGLELSSITLQDAGGGFRNGEIQGVDTQTMPWRYSFIVNRGKERRNGTNQSLFGLVVVMWGAAPTTNDTVTFEIDPKYLMDGKELSGIVHVGLFSAQGNNLVTATVRDGKPVPPAANAVVPASAARSTPVRMWPSRETTDDSQHESSDATDARAMEAEPHKETQSTTLPKERTPHGPEPGEVPKLSTGWYCFQGTNSRTGMGTGPAVRIMPKVQWKSTDSFGSQILVGQHGVYALEGNGETAYALLDAETGHRKWAQFSLNVIGKSCLDKDTLYVPMLGYGKPQSLFSFAAVESGLYDIFTHNAEFGTLAGKAISRSDSLLVMGAIDEGDMSSLGPAVVNGTMYFVDSTYSSESQKGTTSIFARYGAVWQYDFPESMARSGLPGSPPAVVDKVVYCLAGKIVVALDAMSGKQVWIHELASNGLSGPVVADKHLFIIESQGMSCLDRASGQRLWQFEAPGDVGEHLGCWPAVVGNVIVCAMGDGNLYGLDTASGKVEWKLECDGVWSVTAAEDVAYVLAKNDALLAVEAATGKRLWRLSPGEITHGFAPPIVDGVIYLSIADGVYALSADSSREPAP